MRAAPLPFAVAAVCLTLAAGGGAARDWGRYDRSALAAGELWRLVTAHFVHLGVGHLWLNLVALALLALLVEDALASGEWLAATAAAVFAIDLGLYAFDQEVAWYVGLSGVLHGYAAAGALLLAARGERIGFALLTGLIAKIAWEQHAGAISFSAAATGGPVVVAAHLYGAIGGLAAGFAALLARARRAPPHAL